MERDLCFDGAAEYGNRHGRLVSIHQYRPLRVADPWAVAVLVFPPFPSIDPGRWTAYR